ncbi:class I SAM-dependent methyltransferase [Natrinema ejinorense]|uniref:Uncharacterized protein n=1 Tax=Natrinema ejinorense TaxID=373386 RepID=A0A2A5QWX2_9EURY|nr:class I SAM-dependent methyltransferase [Natrinema ejinorense]PCR91330.1 hypothetical protein CP557_12820 [Natrinema ejinorense]
MQRKRFDTEAIVDFYNDTAWEYRFFRSDANLHYGFYDDDHTSHREAMERSNGVCAAKLDVDATDTLLDIGTGRGSVPTRVAATIDIKSESSVEQAVTLYHQCEILEGGIAIHGDFTADFPA